MFTKLTDTSKAAVFAVLVLCMAVGAALLLRFLDLPLGLGLGALWSSPKCGRPLQPWLLPSRHKGASPN
jgi:hypothetical protein